MEKNLTLWETFAEVPDPRQASGRRYPLVSVLTMVAVALLSGARSLYAIAQFGRDRGQGFARALGFKRGTTPCCSALHYLFVALDVGAFEGALARWVKGRVAEGWMALSVDGKTLRGTQGHEVPGVHLLALYAHEAQAVLQQVSVGRHTNEHKAALAALKILPLEAKVVLGDALFCQRDLSRVIVRRGGDYLFPVKANQPELLASLKLAFEDADFSPLGTRRGVGGA
jgi:hypothetical protein